MLLNTCLTTAAFKSAAAVNYQQQANMATLKEIQMRLKSIKNIAKITKSMKMIASTKMVKAQRMMETARFYGETSSAIASHAKVKESTAEHGLFIAVTSDRGLCGGVHSAVSKVIKRSLNASPAAAQNTSVVVLGDKARSQIGREFKGNIKMSFNQLGKNTPTFEEAALIAQLIIKNKELNQIEKTEIVFNHFKSVIAYEPTKMHVTSLKDLTTSEKLSSYEIEEEVLTNFHEFLTANSIYWAMCEGHASEISSRRTAMENATKNAGDIIDSLTLTYNRSRQAAITNELCDIITGASAL